MSGEESIFDRPGEHLPGVIANFGVVSVEADLEVVPTIIVEIKCKACGGAELEIRELRLGEEDDDEDAATVGCAFTCRSCGHTATLFNAATDGYDGAFGNNDHLKGPTVAAPIIEHGGAPVPPGRFAVNFTYNDEELDDTAREAGRPPQDMFDWIEVYILEGEGWEQVWDFECA